MPAPKPTIYLIAGCNGAGKTTFAKESAGSYPVRTLNVQTGFKERRLPAVEEK